jgi:hypothetical protein
MKHSDRSVAAGAQIDVAECSPVDQSEESRKRTKGSKTRNPTAIVMKKLRGIVATGLALLLIGCVHKAGADFDTQKVNLIKKGQTTEAGLVEWFGPPFNRSTTSEGMTTLSWSYVEIHHTPGCLGPRCISHIGR